MTTELPDPSEPSSPARPKGPRLWPAWLILAAQAALLSITVMGQIDNQTRFLALVVGPGVCVLAFLGWLVFASRTSGWERAGLPLLAIACAVAMAQVVDPSTVSAFWTYGAPLCLFTITLGETIARTSPASIRLAATTLLMVAGWGLFALVRLDGFDGSFIPEFAWRWTLTAEEKLMASSPTPPAGAMSESPSSPPRGVDWPSFRGPTRNSRVELDRIDTDWTRRPPKERWRADVGPGWSSFAAVGDRLFTQEQFGAEETVVCYDANTGKVRWRRGDRARFTETVAGAGPRATPTFHQDRIYALGATGILNCLSAADGEPIWSHDLVKEVGATLPQWGFASSPLVIDGVAIVFADGGRGRGLVAYDAMSGELRWSIDCAGMNYSSAQPAEIAGKKLVLFPYQGGILAIDVPTGKVIWKHTPEGWREAHMVQPQAIDGSSLIVSLGDGIGVARLGVERAGDEWRASTGWKSNRLRPSFNDFVYHEGHIYGFDQNIFACVNATNGERAWKQGRYGFGQALLFVKQGLLLVVTETGDLVLLKADPKGPTELARIPALNGKTWNHPAYARGRLYLRNAQGAVCFELPLLPDSNEKG